MPTLPVIINRNTTGHFSHHQYLHAFYNAHADTLESRLQALEAGLLIPPPRLQVVTFSKPGVIDDFLGTMPAPAIFDHTALRVQVRVSTAIAGSGATFEGDVLRNGSSIFTPGTYPKPIFGSGQPSSSSANAVPDPAKAGGLLDATYTCVGIVNGTPTAFPEGLTIQAVLEEA